jgi:diacylglycerol O-acyltransferase / wax synthase
MMPVTTGSDIADPLQRLAAVRASTSTMKDLASARGAQALVEISQAMPGALLGLVGRFSALMAGGAFNLTVTNVPGPRAPLYFCGARAVDGLGAGPFPDGLGLIHLVTSYCGNLFCSVTADREMMPDPAFYSDCLDEAFGDLMRAVGAEWRPGRHDVWP